MFTRVSSEEFQSLMFLRDSAPSSEFLHSLVHDKTLTTCMSLPLLRELQVGRMCAWEHE